MTFSLVNYLHRRGEIVSVAFAESREIDARDYFEDTERAHDQYLRWGMPVPSISIQPLPVSIHGRISRRLLRKLDISISYRDGWTHYYGSIIDGPYISYYEFRIRGHIK